MAATLSRVAEVSGAKTDTAIAEALDVTPQVLANWRSRGTIPYERLVAFAAREEVSLDHLLFGVGSRRPRLTALDWTLLNAVIDELGRQFKDRSENLPPMRELFYYGSLIYNRVAGIDEPLLESTIRQEVEYALKIVSDARARTSKPAAE